MATKVKRSPLEYTVHFGTGIYCTKHKVDWLFCFCPVPEIKSHYETKYPCHDGHKDWK